MSFLAGQSELVFRADEMQVFSGQWDLTGAGFSFFWADGGAQRLRRVFIRTPCGVQGELTNGWLSRPRAITFRRKYCVAAARSRVGAGQSCAGMVSDGMGRCGMRRTGQGTILKDVRSGIVPCGVEPCGVVPAPCGVWGCAPCGCALWGCALWGCALWGCALRGCTGQGCAPCGCAL